MDNHFLNAMIFIVTEYYDQDIEETGALQGIINEE